MQNRLIKFALFLTITCLAIPAKAIEVKWPTVVMQDFETQITVTHTPEESDSITIRINGVALPLVQSHGQSSASIKLADKTAITITAPGQTIVRELDPIPLWVSILPPLLAILMALITKEVFSSLFIGLLLGTTVIFRYAGFNWFIAFFKGTFAIADTYVIEALMSTEHLSIIVFSMMIGGMVVLITLNGGMKGIVNILSRYATTRRSGQMITWLMGILIFFDDYANTLVVGNTMRPITDRLKISREKLAYIVDSTTAPVAAIAFITTWIGAELSYIQEGLVHTQINESPYIVFLSSLKYSFYPILTLVFMLMLILMQRDFGLMWKKEKEAITADNITEEKTTKRPPQVVKEFEVPEHIKGRWYNAAIPVGIVIFGTLGGLVYTGWDATVWSDGSLSAVGKLSATIGAADTFKALIWSSLTAMMVAMLLSLSQKILNIQESMEGILNGFKTMFNAIIILILAWAMATITKELHTADFITGSLSHMQVSPYVLPFITFIFSAMIAFSTGSSWGTMAIIYPLILPAAWKIGLDNGLAHDELVMVFHNVVASVLAGAVWGDHCSPISDTTILSSLSCSCNHINHVQTQMPYAITVGATSLIAGVLPAGFGWPVWISYLASIAILFLIIRSLGKKYPD